MNEDANSALQPDMRFGSNEASIKTKSMNTFAVLNGIYLGVILIVFSLIIYISDLPRTSPANYLAYLLIIGMLIYAIITYRDKELEGFISYGKSLGLGTLIGLYASVLLAIYTYLFYQFFDPSEIQTILNDAENALIDRGMSDAEVEAGMSVTKMFTNPPVMAAFTIVGFTFWSFIISLIVSIFVKKDNPDKIFNE